MIIKVLVCLVMAAIVYQDFKYRAIHWLLFLVLSVLLFIDGVISKEFEQYSIDIACNAIIIIIQFSVLLIFYSLRGRKLNSIINKIIGTGDIVFIFVLSLAFPWESFLFYYLGAMIFSVIVWIAVKNLSRNQSELIPFAGLMAAFCFIIFTTELLYPPFSRMNNGFLTMLLHG